MGVTLADEPMSVWSKVLTREQITNAVKWYRQHTRHILQITAGYIDVSAPVEKDNPEVWTPIQWAWFVKHYARTAWYYEE